MLSLTTGLFRRADAVMSPRPKKPAAERKKKLSIALSQESMRKIEAAAKANKRSISSMIEIAIDYWSEKEGKGTKKT